MTNFYIRPDVGCSSHLWPGMPLMKIKKNYLLQFSIIINFLHREIFSLKINVKSTVIVGHNAAFLFITIF